MKRFFVTMPGVVGLVEKGIDKPKKLHDTLILSKIFVTFEQKLIFFAIRSGDSQATWPLLGGKNSQLWGN
jgi:hypothetical protein